MGATGESAMQRLLQAIAAQNWQQNQQLLNLQPQHTDILAAWTQVAQNALAAPNQAYVGFFCEGRDAILGTNLWRFTWFFDLFWDGWLSTRVRRPRERKTFALAPQKNPLKWLQTQNITAATTWDALRAGFLKTFWENLFWTKSREGWRKNGDTQRTFKQFSRSQLRCGHKPWCFGRRKTNRLSDGLLMALEAYFVRDTPQTDHSFTTRIKSVAVEHFCKQNTAFSKVMTASFAALANAKSAAASALALLRFLPGFFDEY